MRLKELVQRELLSTGNSYRKLAQKIDVSHGIIGNILADDPPRNLKVLRKLAVYFQVDLHELLEGAATKEKVPRYAIHSKGDADVAGVLVLLERLGRDEREALKICAETLISGQNDVRLSLMSQIKIAGEMVRLRQANLTKKAAGHHPKQT